MSDTKKPTVSEIRAREQAATEGPWEHGANNKEPDGRIWVSLGATESVRGKVVFMGLGTFTEEEILNNIRFAAHSRTDIPHLLRLVERMGKALERKLWCCNHVLSHDASCEFCKEARALLEEVKE